MSELAPESPKRRRRPRLRKPQTDTPSAASPEATIGREDREGRAKGAKAEAKPHAPPGPKPTAPKPKKLSLQQLAAEAYEALTLLTQALGRAEHLGSELAQVDLKLQSTFSLQGHVPKDSEGPARLLEQMRDQVRALSTHVALFQEGAVFCFLTERLDSPYARPGAPTEVFAGYNSNGKPEWIPFATLCLERKEPRVDRLFGEQPEILALVLGPQELGAGLSSAFGHKERHYKVWGQVVLGLVPRDLHPRSKAERIALTLQVVETTERGERGRLMRRLRLNVIGLATDSLLEAAANADESSPQEALRRVLRATRTRLDALGQQFSKRDDAERDQVLQGQVLALLTRLRQDVLRALKARDYRTQHAQERHESKERPTSLAISDALSAPEGRFLRDERKDTVVVLGPKHRVHVFSMAGRHVTSLELTPAEVERRVELKRWLFLERVGTELFKAALKRQVERPTD